MAIYYVVLAAITAIVAVVVISAGNDEHGQPSIAGGYDLAGPNACLGAPPPAPTGRPLPDTAPPQPQVAGPSFDVKQSGQFVNLSNIQGTLGGQLRLEDAKGKQAPRPISGDVSCVNGKSIHFSGTATPGSPSTIEGSLGGEKVSA